MLSEYITGLASIEYYQPDLSSIENPVDVIRVNILYRAVTAAFYSAASYSVPECNMI